MYLYIRCLYSDSHSFIFSKVFILVRVTIQPKLILGQNHPRNTPLIRYQKTHIPICEETGYLRWNPCKHVNVTITWVQDWARDPVAVRRDSNATHCTTVSMLANYLMETVSRYVTEINSLLLNTLTYFKPWNLKWKLIITNRKHTVPLYNSFFQSKTWQMMPKQMAIYFTNACPAFLVFFTMPRLH